MPDDSRISIDSATSNSDYNRIRLDDSFRDKILAEFDNDSSESLPVPFSISEDSLASNPPKKSPPAAEPPLSTSPTSKAKAPSRLNQVVQSSDIPTPKPHQGADYFSKMDSMSPNTPPSSNADLTPTVSSTKGSNLSKIATAEDTEAKNDKASRPGPIRRLTSRIKKSISSKG